MIVPRFDYAEVKNVWAYDIFDQKLRATDSQNSVLEFRNMRVILVSQCSIS